MSMALNNYENHSMNIQRTTCVQFFLAIAISMAASRSAYSAEPTTLVFQEGAEVTRNGQGTGQVYSGTQDTILMYDARTKVANSWKYTAESISADWSQITKNRDEQGLLRFDNVIGTGATLIPKGARIKSASLTLTARNPTPSPIHLHRMLIDWSEAKTTWSNFGNRNKAGVDVDGTEATKSFVTAPGKSFTVDITEFVQNWSDGSPNYGVVLYHTATTRDGVDWWSSEAGNAASKPNISVRPRLAVTFSVPDKTKSSPK